MAYHFVNVETGEYFYCDEQVWLRALDTAEKNGWDPYGTLYDIEYSIEDECVFLDDATEILYAVLVTMGNMGQWKGSYTEKCNQVLDFNDTVYLAEALEGTDTDPELVRFIDKGTFRICAE
jgi:hypothetical protein